MKVLQVSNLTKTYGEMPVLKGVSLALEEGERVALMGPSGSGKSTLLNCVGGIDRPDEGQIQVGGDDLGGLGEEALCRLRRDRVTTVFQFFHLLPTLSVAENVAFPLQLKGVSGAELQDRVDQAITEVSLKHRIDAMPDELSGGEMQRVAIARALVGRPSLILADEPTGNLDSQTGETILDLMESLSDQHRIAMLLVTHSPSVARICTRTLLLRDGSLDSAA
ncbi:MAG: ABC transporter ATP-binding protein [Verrucomicrobiota bacterium]